MNQKEFAASWNSTNNGYANSYWNSRRIVTVIAGSSFEPTEESSELYRNMRLCLILGAHSLSTVSIDTLLHWRGVWLWSCSLSL